MAMDPAPAKDTASVIARYQAQPHKERPDLRRSRAPLLGFAGG